MKACQSMLAIITMLLLLPITIQAQTEVTAPITGTPAAGSYFSYSSITVSPDFSFTATANNSLKLFIANSDCRLLTNSFSQNQNYISTYTPRIALGTINTASLTSCDLMQTVEYFDGLGRPSQTVQVKGSPLGNDIVQAFAYDPFGRETKKYLPYAATTADGSFKADALSPNQGVYSFYNPTGSGVTGTQQSNGVVIITAPTAQTIFEPSPLNRIVEQGAPGSDWQPVSNNTSGHTLKTVCTINNETPLTDTANTMLVALYRTVVNTNQSETLIRGNAQGDYYKAGQLNVNIIKDENWKSGRGGTTEEYKDKQDRVVLKRMFSYSGTTLQIFSTYYVYDDYGNLAFVLPPGTNPDGAGVPQYAGSLGYQYRYDERNRLTQKKIPGKGWEFTVYNRLDKPVLTQDSLQRISNQWTVTKYDDFGRVIMTGLWNAGTVYSLSTLQSNIYAVTQWDTRDLTNNTTSYPSGYVLGSYPIISKTLTINYYDDYNIPGLPSGYKVTNGVSNMPKELLTASKIAVLNTIANATPDMLWEVTYYDDFGRNIRNYKQHYLGGTANVANFDVMLTTYNFNDQITNINRRHFNTASLTAPQLTIINQYSYDHMGRKLTTREQITNGGQTPDPTTNVLLSKIDYNEVGQLWKKNLHSIDSTNFKQTITYGYNERNWLQTISSSLFAEQLYYNTGTNKLYNGNIAYQYWGVPGNLNKNYSYSYDQLNRLNSGNSSSGYHEQGITYDVMGNIMTLNRYTAGNPTDQLTYTYTAGTNRLQSVTDHSGSDSGQKNGVTNYTYDGNGNLASDDGKGITAIRYNLLNLPQEFGQGSTLMSTYAYDAEGHKLNRLIGTNKTDYISGIQYDGTSTSSTISFIQTEEGRALPNGPTGYNYEYTLGDHLRNSRVSFDTGTGLARQVQTDDYYPFGKEIISGTVPSQKNEYLFNKKELQENIGLYDFDARFYDPITVRWNSTDSHAERYEAVSPYSYAFNNPIRFIDKKGQDPGDVIIIFTGANQSSLQRADLTAIKKLEGYLRQNVPKDVGIYRFNTEYMEGDGFGILAPLSIIAYEHEKYPNSKVVIYGYSYGGVLATQLAKQLKQANINVDLLITVDAANGPFSNSVDRKISANVKKNINFYENNESTGIVKKAVGSHGGPNTGSQKGQVTNTDLSKSSFEGQSIDHYNVDDATVSSVQKDIVSFFNSVKDGENKTLTRDELRQKFHY